MHRWTLSDNRRVFEGLLNDESPSSISNATGIPKKSVQMKISNFKYLLTGQGLSNYSQDSKIVVDEYKAKKAEKKADEVTQSIENAKNDLSQVILNSNLTAEEKVEMLKML